jgi:putative copper resistance protein D|nr:MAG: hypothetical protein KatS3mg041_0865 [Bacteroidota bacterium]
MRMFYLISVFLHILAAALWVGGMLFLAVVLVPALRDGEFDPVRRPLLERTAMRFRLVGWVALAVVVFTGLFNLFYRWVPWEVFWGARWWNSPLGRTVGYKLLVVALMLLVSAAHDLWIGPRAIRLWRLDPEGSSAVRYRFLARWLGRVTLFLGLLAMMLGVILVRGL